MTRRRQYGSGSIYQRQSDGRVLGVIQAGWNDRGGRRTITVSAAPKDGTQAALREAEATVKRKLRDKLKDIDTHGLPGAGGDDRATVKAWAEQWLTMKATSLRPKSYETTSGSVRNWIVPTIGHKALRGLTPGDVRAVTTAILKAGRKPSTAQRAHNDLTLMLKDATLEGHQVPQRVLLVKPPPRNSNDRAAMTAEEAARVLAVAATLPHASRWLAALLQGMRTGETLGLELDRDLGDALDISWQLQALPYKDPDNKRAGFRVPIGYEARRIVDSFHLVRPKTKAGRRVIPVVPWMRQALDTWYAVMPPSPHGLVWPTLAGRPANTRHDRTEWEALQGSAGVGHPAGRFYVPHEARHTTATLLVELGVDRSVIERIVGQSKLVESYVHPQQAAMHDALERVSARLQLS